MKVVGVISSANFHGHGATLVREALEAAAAEGAVTEEIFLPKFRIEFCLGCLRCLAEGKCHQADDFESLRSLLHEADGIILGAPTFGAAPNARMKNFLDRLGMFEYVTGSLGGRHLAAISTASSPAAAGKVAKSLAGLLASGVFGRAYISGTMGAKARGQGNQPDAASLRKARTLGRRLASDIRHGRKHRVRALPRTLLNRLMLRPMFRGAILKYKEGMMRGVYCHLKEKGLI